MKKFLSGILCIAFICSCFAGCSAKVNNDMTEENMTAAADTVMTALKEFDTNTLDEYVESSTLSTIMSYAKSHDQFVSLGKAIFENLTYEVKSVDVDNSTITLSVKNKDLYQVAADFASELKGNYSTIKLLTKLSDDTFLDENLTTLCDSIDSASLLEDAVEVTLTAATGSKHLVLTFDETAENGVSGGALYGIKEIF